MGLERCKIFRNIFMSMWSREMMGLIWISETDITERIQLCCQKQRSSPLSPLQWPCRKTRTAQEGKKP